MLHATSIDFRHQFDTLAQNFTALHQTNQMIGSITDPAERQHTIAALQRLAINLKSSLNQYLTTYNACVIKARRGQNGQSIYNMEYILEILNTFSESVA